MISRVLSSAILGIDAYQVEVEVDIALGLPAFSTVGSRKEQSKRARTA
ncbi:MAG: hypothetical protein OS130_05250 [Thermodesulfobacteriota bacterium]|nr:MAG: hypothetical protein OS130_05250 [Thermodesulfobacteriota bacterium]